MNISITYTIIGIRLLN